TACCAQPLHGGPLPLDFQDSCFPRRPPAYVLAAHRRLPLHSYRTPAGRHAITGTTPVAASEACRGRNGSLAGARLPNRPIVRGVAAEVSAQRSGAANGGGGPQAS